MPANNKTLVDELKIEWNRLWRERRDDKIRAEGIAVNNYSQLFIDQGTIIRATRDFQSLNFRDILQQHEIRDFDRYTPPDPYIGGWTKFIKDNVSKPKGEKKAEKPKEKKNINHQSKQGSRGWLHTK